MQLSPVGCLMPNDMHRFDGVMTERSRHLWDVSIPHARAIQEELSRKVEKTDRFEGPIDIVAGVDVGFEDHGSIARAAIVLLKVDTLEVVDSVLHREKTGWPYIPGFLSFRELPVVMAAIDRLRHWPDLWLCDGQGLAHPRRLGIASHLGVLLDSPTIGVGKSRLCGIHDLVPDERGNWVPLRDQGEIIGAVLRSRPGVRPLYISIGHRISLETAVYEVMRNLTRFRLPEAIRSADRLASAVSRKRRPVS